MPEISKTRPTPFGDSASTVLTFIDLLIPNPRSFAIRLWDGQCIPAQGHADFTLVINNPAALRRMFQPPLELNVGEAYVRGDFEVEGENFALAKAMRVLAHTGVMTSVGYIEAESPQLYTAARLWNLLRAWWKLPHYDENENKSNPESLVGISGAPSSQARKRSAIEFHYNLSNEFYELWLGKKIAYSCAYYQNGMEDLDTAQELKFEHICRKLRLQPGERLLDIGCGWGGLAIYAAQHFGVRALGITLSDQQAQLARQRIASAGLSDEIEIRLLDYRDVREAPFDKAVSVEMFEHVGRRHLPGYFKGIFDLLKPGGLFLLSGTFTGVDDYESASKWLKNAFEYHVMGRGRFNERYLFPSIESLPVGQIVYLMQQAGFEIGDVENIREHYTLTLRQWIEKFDQYKAEAIHLVGNSIFRIWRLYLYAYLLAFETGTIGEYQALVSKPAQGSTGLPLTRADLYDARAERAPRMASLQEIHPM